MELEFAEYNIFRVYVSQTTRKQHGRRTRPPRSSSAIDTSNMATHISVLPLGVCLIWLQTTIELTSVQTSSTHSHSNSTAGPQTVDSRSYAYPIHEQVRSQNCLILYLTSFEGIPSLFLPSRKSGQEQGTETILEVQTIAPNAARSWFLGESEVVAGMSRRICFMNIH